ncbi:MAG TPA: 6-phosphogluconolactonase [Acidobacteriota bacterium]|nr:6-phosphogluconolactonase [Acidobacteriota bacterium]
MTGEQRTFATPQELFRDAAHEFVREAQQTVQANGRFTVVLSGGSTPKNLYALLAQQEFATRIPWKQTFVFWGDERHVPPDHPESNYRMAYDAMLSKVPIPPSNIHRIHGEESPAEAADQYEKVIRDFLPFDWVFLGMGPDGHTASLFPGTKALRETQRMVVSNWVGKLNTYRITMTAPVFNSAAHVVCLITGEDKAAPLKAVLEGPYEPDQLPVQLVNPVQGRLLWLIDQSAARLLGR